MGEKFAFGKLVSFVGLDLYGGVHVNMQQFSFFPLLKGNLCGVTIGIGISLILDHFASRNKGSATGGKGDRLD